ncbi:MAG: chromosome segregation protein SMC [Ignavibacteria bacterium RIFCSPLOWO2_12_FULL_56_21]|nr:MAG: chromosome segregation protein SMC [Ignavibacteria bacterium RIFCSPLOWO2_12_FULL_56_21]
MYLSKLEVLGFKSFANKIDLKFDAGMTAIVGPNGCGKTNVVDAIRWALGEQKPTTLRSDKMEDVIFNGTKSRKPLGMAEVSITIENSKGILPSDYSEVTIMRRVYRSGESEYYLNKALCRLKDIRDLFMDTGMGSDAYSVIELKMVEGILSDNSDERRRLFEESAGVTKYKHRRKEAVRRLESVRADLLRVGDIMRGVEKAVSTLERQAQKAEKYNELSAELRALEIDHIEREYSSIVSRIDPLRSQLSVAVTEKNRIEVEVKQEEALLDVFRSELQELEDQLHAAQDALAAKQSQIHEFQQVQATSKERRRSLEDNVQRYRLEIKDLGRKQEELLRQQEEVRERLHEIQTSIAQADAAYAVRKAELEAFEQQLNLKKAELKSAQETVITLLHELGDLRNKEGQARARIENIRGRVGYTAEENDDYRAEIEKNVELIAQLSSDHRDLRRRSAEAEVRVHQMETYRVSLQQGIDDLKHRQLDVRGELERKLARIDFLKGLVESFDGYSEGARFLITDPTWKERIHTTVGEAVATDTSYRIALENALGEAIGYIIVDDAGQAYAAMDYLKKQEKGKATFICLDRIPATAGDKPAIDGPGVYGWARMLVSCDAPLTRLFDYLLDATVIVDDVTTANRIIGQHRSLRCVTTDGDIVSGTGVLKGGSARQDEGGHISKKTQLDELSKESAHLQATQEDLIRQIGEQSKRLEEVDLKRLQDESRAVEQEKVQVEVRIAQLEFEKKRAEENIVRNEGETTKLDREIDDLRLSLERLTPVIEDIERRKTEAEQTVGSATTELETMEALWAEYSAKANESNMHLLSLRSEERSQQQAIDHGDSTLRTIAATIEERTREIAEAGRELDEIARRVSDTQQALDSAQLELEFESGRKKEVDKDYGEKRSRIHEIELKLKDERLKQEGSLKAAYDLEFKIQELTVKAESLKIRANEEFVLDLTVKEFPDAEAYDWNEAREMIREKKDKLRGLGAVNFAAFDEYKSEKERLDFMTAQKNDLEESERTLLATIDEINTTAQKKFMETFEKIRENFVLTFKGLFDEGDECDLFLEDGVDPLEAKIGITAKPRGKRPTSIDLLSGGEKTLTAIALLFAIYLVKPSPFCILDEVDAPLDDTNIDRFTRIIRRFSDNTQFIIVTHNKRTMEAANAMYGVTMEEEGVSKLVSVRFNEPVKSS